jgi:excisionase family DNA binding protein
MLTAANVAAMLGLKERTVYALAKDGELPCHRFNTSVRFELADVEDFKAKCRSASTKPNRRGSGSSRPALMAKSTDIAASFRAVGVSLKP